MIDTVGNEGRQHPQHDEHGRPRASGDPSRESRCGSDTFWIVPGQVMGHEFEIRLRQADVGEELGDPMQAHDQAEGPENRRAQPAGDQYG